MYNLMGQIILSTEETVIYFLSMLELSNKAGNDSRFVPYSSPFVQ